MKTLIIHPLDSSTSFLSKIYENIEDKTVITGGITKREVHDLIKEHDRIIMLGHGCIYGLFSMNRYGSCTMIIDKDTAPLLENKENIFIWCNADVFVENFSLKGFYSGMFISEIEEAMYCGVWGFKGCDYQNLEESNNEFSNIMSKYINNPINLISENVKKDYGEIAINNPFALYNNKRLNIK